MSVTPIMMPAPPVVDGDAHKPQTGPKTGGGLDPASFLKDIIPFAGLADPVIDAIAEAADCKNYSAGQTVFSMGQFDGAEFFVVLSGTMRVSVMDPQTGSVLVEEFTDGALFGLDLTFSGEESEVFQRLAVTAEDELRLMSVDSAALATLASQRPSLMRNLANFFANELAAKRFRSLTVQVAPERRVYAELLKYVQRDAATGGWRIDRMPKHRELAARADVDESIAAAAVASLIQDNVARRDYPGLVIEDMTRLNELAS